jgi:tight adherence protein B
MSNEELIPFLLVLTATALCAFGLWLMASTLFARSHAQTTAPDELPEDPLPWKSREQRAAEEEEWSFSRMIDRTGLDITAWGALGLILLSGVALGGFVFVWRLNSEPWLAAPAFLLGALVPFVIFWWLQGRWTRSIQRQLPDIFFLMGRSLRAGRSLEQSIELVAEQGGKPVAPVFDRMCRQLSLGLPVEEVVRRSSTRLNLLDFNLFAAVVALHRTTGGNLPLLLDRLATATRDRNQFEGHFRSVTTLSRYSAAFIASMVCVILVYLFFFQRQWALRFFDTSVSYTGLYLLLTALGLEVLGVALMYVLLRHNH